MDKSVAATIARAPERESISASRGMSWCVLVFASSSLKIRAHRHQVAIGDVAEVAEVQFFFYTQDLTPKAVISLYDDPDMDLLARSFNVVYACNFERYEKLRVVDVAQIQSVVSMQPFPEWADPYVGLYFLVEKSGLEDTSIGGWQEPVANEAGDE